jgi:hypothetical protein
MQRIGGDDTALQIEQLQHLQGACRLVASGRFLLGQGHAGFHREDVDQMQRRGLLATRVGAAQGLAIDGHHSRDFEPIGLGEGRHETTECLLEGPRLEQAEYAAEGVVARHPCSRRRKSRNSSSFASPKSAMSEQDSAPHSVAASAITKTSRRSCLALAARGFGNRRKPS